MRRRITAAATVAMLLACVAPSWAGNYCVDGSNLSLSLYRHAQANAPVTLQLASAPNTDVAGPVFVDATTGYACIGVPSCNQYNVKVNGLLIMNDIPLCPTTSGGGGGGGAGKAPLGAGPTVWFDGTDVTIYFSHGIKSTTENLGSTLVAYAGTVADFRCASNTAPDSGKTLVFTAMKNGSATSITCTITSAGTSCTSATTTTVAAGDRWSYRMDPSAAQGARDITCSASITG